METNDMAAAVIAVKLNKLGFSADAGAVSRMCEKYGYVYRNAENACFSARTPRGSSGVPKVLVFEVNPSRRYHGRICNEGEIRVRMDDANWVGKVAVWIEAQIPAAVARAAQSAVRADAARKLRADSDTIRGELEKLAGVLRAEVWNDGRAVCQANVTVKVSGADAAELTARVEALLRALGTN